jgi:hypothetical protein
MAAFVNKGGWGGGEGGEKWCAAQGGSINILNEQIRFQGSTNFLIVGTKKKKEKKEIESIITIF